MTDKMSGIKAGDRVRVTFEASVIDAGHVGEHPIRFRPDGASIDALPGVSILNQPTFHIERIEKSLGVGDRVKDIAYGFGEGEILAVDGRIAFVRWDMKKYEAASIYLSNLERVS